MSRPEENVSVKPEHDPDPPSAKSEPSTVVDVLQQTRSNLTETTNLLLLFAICLRCIISQYPYSGHATPPMYGDFEAQRHWQEITVNLPARQWYTNSTDNDLLYWGLDYPPLTAYHSWLTGRVGAALNVSYVQLHTSRGITTEAHKTFMRNTVLIADLLVYLPVMWLLARSSQQLFAKRMQQQQAATGRFAHAGRLLHLSVLLLFPGQMLIDNGHFQYNNIALALSALAVVALMHGHLKLGCASFSLALNYKQMVLYHALPVFVFILRACLPTQRQKWRMADFVRNVAVKAVVVLGVFGVLWSPWLLRSPADSLQVLHRIFPVARGVFEDKVANVWCVLNVVVNLKQTFDNSTMAIVCMVCTIVAAAPSLYVLWTRPHAKTLLLALINTSLAFFLLSFQVHEKTILLVALPVGMYLTHDPLPCLIFLQTATFSMLPLLRQDGLLYATAYISLLYMVALRTVVDCQLRKSDRTCWWDILLLGRLVGLVDEDASDLPCRRIRFPGRDTILMGLYYATFVLHAVMFYLLAFVQPPEGLPHLYQLLIAAVSATYFGSFFLYFSFEIWFVDKYHTDDMKNK